MTVCLSLMLFSALGAGWVKGFGIVKARIPDQIVKFSLLYSVFRMITILLYVGAYVLLFSESFEQSKAFVVMIFIMYVVMMAVSLPLIKKQ